MKMTSASLKTIAIGIGIYSIRDAARILGAHHSTIRRWARRNEGLIPRELGEGEGLLTFAELVELHFVKMFRDEGVSLTTIRSASERAAARYGTDCPFSVKRFDTDGKAIIATLYDSSDRLVMEDVAKGQYVFEKIMRPFFRKLEYGADSDLLRYWPMSKAGRVVLDPKRKFGKPIDAETGVSTQAIFDALNAGGGQSPAEVASWLGIPIAAVRKAAEFERSLSV